MSPRAVKHGQIVPLAQIVADLDATTKAIKSFALSPPAKSVAAYREAVSHPVECPACKERERLLAARQARRARKASRLDEYLSDPAIVRCIFYDLPPIETEARFDL